MARFHGIRWRPPAPRFPSPPRDGERTLPPLEFLKLPGTGPEHITIDQQGRLLTGLADGWIVRVDPADGHAERLVSTGGRPLGMEIAPDGALIVCDAERGLLRIESAHVQVLADVPFASCPAIDSDGTIYFSQSSRRYGLDQYLGDLLEHSGTGRVLRWRDGQVDVIADGLQFANGLLLLPGGTALAVAETAAYRITRVPLDSGRPEPLIDALPGFPDNLTAGDDGLIWIGMASTRDSTLDLLLPRPPWLRAALWSLPDRLRPGPKDIAWALAVDRTGVVVRDLHAWDTGFHEVTAARQHSGKLYLASIAEPHLAVANLNRTAPGPAVMKWQGDGGDPEAKICLGSAEPEEQGALCRRHSHSSTARSSLAALAAM
ncbi:MAG: SMP-30/gluconolactonase/LRE family protein [Streptosporangiaceae bacterium]|jgi:sugar lactone lactonase YvrE